MTRCLGPVLILVLFSCVGCSDRPPSQSTNKDKEVTNSIDKIEKKEPNDVHYAQLSRGKELASRHCSQCHLIPSPADLPNDKWPFVVQWMGHYLGHQSFKGADKSLIMPQLVPGSKKLTRQELNDIEYYFVESSLPEMEPSKVMPGSLKSSEHFLPVEFVQVPANRLVTGIFIDETNDRIYLANGSGSNLLEYDFKGNQLAIHDTKKTQAVQIQKHNEQLYATLIGDMYALDEFGAVMRIEKQIEKKRYRYTYPVRNYFRLAHVSMGDLNSDGFLDYCTCGFGSSGNGAFSIFYGTDNDQRTRRYDLINHCGPISSEILDIDNDGDLDLLVLTTQGFHDFWLFENIGNERFIGKRIWKKSSSTGSTSMQAADLDGDGQKDIVITCGNNFEMADAPVRPYHGVFVYKNIGNAEFEEAFFYPLPGAARMVIVDLNNDNRKDIAAISSLPDWRIKDPISTLLLSNEGEFKFAASTIAGLKGTQWLSIAAGDIDKDGDNELFLGAMNTTPELTGERASNFQSAINRQPSVLLLDNQTINSQLNK